MSENVKHLIDALKKIIADQGEEILSNHTDIAGFLENDKILEISKPLKN